MTVVETTEPAARPGSEEGAAPTIDQARIDDLLARWDTDAGPGCCVAIVHGGRPVFERGYGMADLEHGVTLDPDSVFDIASMSKQFTAAAILLLAESGQIDLDDEIQAYVPEIPEYDRPITLQHLVHHTSGIRDYIALRMLAGAHDSDYFDMQDVLDLLSRQGGVNFAAGSRHMYSNSGYVLLAIIVSRVTGISFGEHCRATFFESLGMTASRFREDVTAITPGLVQSYGRNRDGEVRKTIPNDDAVGDGGLLSSLRDLVRWEGNYVEGTVGGSDFAERMATVGTPPEDEESYAFGLSVGAYRGLRTVSHGGNLHGFAGEFLRLPEQGLTVICMGNSGSFDAAGMARRVVDVILEERLGPPPEAAGANLDPHPAGADDDDLQRFAGFYRQTDTGLVLEVACGDDGLAATVADTRIPMRRSAGGRFIGDYQGLALPIEFVPADRPAELRVIHEDTTLITATRVEPPSLDAAQLHAYTGDYWSEELDIAARIRVDGARLLLTRGSATPVELRPMLADEFATPFGGATFHRDGDGPVAGFSLSMSRTVGVRFARATTVLAEVRS